MKTEIGFFQYFTLWKCILKKCNLRSVFPNSLNLYIFGLRATEILIISVLYFVLFNFLCNHFVIVSEPKINLNFCKYNAVTRTDGSSNILRIVFLRILFRKDFDRKIHVVLYTKIDLNLHLVKRTYRAANFFNVSETETYWIILVVIGLLIAKVFLKHDINILFTYSLYSSFYHFLHHIGPKKDLSTTVN